MDNLSNWFTGYAIPQPADEAWGIHLTGVGASNVRPKKADTPHALFGAPPAGIFRHRRDGVRICREFHFVFLARGTGSFTGDGPFTTPVRGGDLLLIPPGLGHRYRFDHASDWQEYWVLFGGPWAEQLRDRGALHHARHRIALSDPSAVVARFLSMSQLLRRRENRAAAGELMALLGMLEGPKVDSERTRNAFEDSFENILRSLSQTPHARIDMPRLAEAAGMSYPHFRRVFKNRLGMSPHQYHLHALVHRAKEMLREEGTNVAAVAERLGFDDPYYFSRIFKQKTGVAPSRWEGG